MVHCSEKYSIFMFTLKHQVVDKVLKEMGYRVKTHLSAALWKLSTDQSRRQKNEIHL